MDGSFPQQVRFPSNASPWQNPAVFICVHQRSSVANSAFSHQRLDVQCPSVANSVSCSPWLNVQRPSVVWMHGGLFSMVPSLRAAATIR